MVSTATRIVRIAVACAVLTLGATACGEDPSDVGGGGSPETSAGGGSTTAPSATETTTTDTTVPATVETTAPTPTTVVGSTPEEAIEAWLTTDDKVYAGDCQDATLEDDLAKECTVLVEDNGDERIYNSGPTFSEFRTWLLVRQSIEGWAVVETASSAQATPHPW